MRQNLFIQFSRSCYFQGGRSLVTTFERLLLLMVGFTSSHQKLALISGGRYLQGVITIGTFMVWSI